MLKASLLAIGILVLCSLVHEGMIIFFVSNDSLVIFRNIFKFVVIDPTNRNEKVFFTDFLNLYRPIPAMFSMQFVIHERLW